MPSTFFSVADRQTMGQLEEPALIPDAKDRWKILLVDDDRDGREAMSEWLTRRGYQCIAVADGEQAIGHLRDGIAVVVTDLKMPRTGGLELLALVKEAAPHAAVILVSGFGTVDTAVQALKEGAFDFLTKPVNLTELTHRIEMALEKRAMAERIAELHAELRSRAGSQNMVGQSEAMRLLFEKIRLVADSRSTVLISGESGTGKELVARSIHDLSARAKSPFVPVNCAAIPETLVESELFGSTAGAYTGATNRDGLFQAAHTGTLFVDEIGELQMSAQSKLLRALETRRVMKVGSPTEEEVDVRVVAATNRDLTERVKEKEFREDLYFRLKVVELRIPPLRERREDIPLLVRYFIDQIASENERPVKEITPEAMDCLRSYHWPGNVRELRNALEGIIVLSMDETIDMKDIPDDIREPSVLTNVVKVGMSMQEIEKEAIQRTLESTNGHRANAAKILGISVRSLQRKINEYDLR